MEIKSWFERLKQRRAEKKLQKLRREFGFIIEEFRICQTASVNELKRHQDLLHDSNAQQLEWRITSSLEGVERIIDTSMSRMQECLCETKKECIDGKVELSRLFIDIQEKLDALKESDTENCSKMNISYQEIKQLLQSIESRIDLVQKNARGIVDATEVMIDEKSESIMLSIDEVKTLMKIVAVNNLLDEIKE